MRMRVSAFPELWVRYLLTRPTRPGVYEIFYGKEASCFYQGRGAVWRGIKLLNLGKTDQVLLPSYHCGVEIEAVLQSGVGIQFYRIQDDMTVDLGTLEEKMRAGCKAVLVTHYYGFAQPIEDIRRLCRKHNLFLIEDCAHALFSSHGGQPLGKYGDIAIFSLPKSLSLPDGGALLINNPDFEGSISRARPSRAVVWKKTLGLVLRSHENDAILRTGLGGIRSLSRKFSPINVGRSYGRGFDISMGHIAMSNISSRIMNGTPIEWVIKKRRAHFQCLLEGIHDSNYWKVCFTSLPHGICPLFFPIRVTGGSRRDLQLALEGLGISTFVFGEQLHPALPTKDFPEAELLSREILCLPVHQELDEERLDSMVHVMNSLRRTSSRTERAEPTSFDTDVTKSLETQGLSRHGAGARAVRSP